MWSFSAIAVLDHRSGRRGDGLRPNPSRRAPFLLSSARVGDRSITTRTGGSRSFRPTSGAQFSGVVDRHHHRRQDPEPRIVIIGVDVAPLVEAELDRRHPDRPKFRPTTPEGFREAWDLNERLWESTLARARRLPSEMLHESVGGKWSFIQTLRHLAFATESWVGRGILGDPSPWHPLSLPWDEMGPRPGVSHERERARRSTRRSPCGWRRWR